IATLTPTTSCCQGGGVDKCTPEASHWANASWVALHFSVDDPHYYRYDYIAPQVSDVGANYTAQAQGDLDCDNTYSTFEMYGSITSSVDGVVHGALYKEQETE